MATENQAKIERQSLFQIPGNRENFDLFYKCLSQPSRELCLCRVQPEERLKILEFFDHDPLKERIHIIDMVKPLRGTMELQHSVIEADKAFGSRKDIFFIYNIEECIRLLKTGEESFFREMNLIRDFFMHFNAVFVFFMTESLVKTMIRHAFDFYDWMSFSFVFVPESKDIESGEKEERKYSGLSDKIRYLEESIKGKEDEKTSAVRLFELGKLYFQAGDYEGALTFFTKALKIFEESKDRVNVGSVRAEMEKVRKLKESNKAVIDAVRQAQISGRFDFNWDELLRRIKLRKVIPVIGQGLFTVQIEPEGKNDVLLYDYLADQVSKECGFTLNLGENHKFAKACAAYLKENSYDYHRLSGFLKKKMNGVRPAPSNSLQKLARIKAFALFITTGYDDLLLQAIKSIRGVPTKVLTNTPWEKMWAVQEEDLFQCIEKLQCTLVAHVFGHLNLNLKPAYMENDILETLLELNRDMVKDNFNNFFRKLRDSSLLYLGCGFDDWLYRLFIRTTANKPYLSDYALNFVADDFSRIKRDPFQELPRFLRDYGAKVFHTGANGDFVDMLFEKLEKAYPEEIIQPVDFPNTVFLSFEGRDRDAARLLAQHLREDGIDVWLDEVIIGSGDQINLTILKAIDRCPVFIPLISNNSKQIYTGDGKMRDHVREWEWGYSRMAAGKEITILPVRIDDTVWNYIPFKAFLSINVPGGRREGQYKELLERLREVQHRVH